MLIMHSIFRLWLLTILQRDMKQNTIFSFRQPTSLPRDTKQNSIFRDNSQVFSGTL